MTSPIRTAHDGLELPAIGFGTYRVQGLDGLAAIGHALENGYLLCSRPFRRGRAQGHPHSLARMQIYSVI